MNVLEDLRDQILQNPLIGPVIWLPPSPTAYALGHWLTSTLLFSGVFGWV